MFSTLMEALREAWQGPKFVLPPGMELFPNRNAVAERDRALTFKAVLEASGSMAGQRELLETTRCLNRPDNIRIAESDETPRIVFTDVISGSKVGAVQFVPGGSGRKPRFEITFLPRYTVWRDTDVIAHNSGIQRIRAVELFEAGDGRNIHTFGDLANHVPPGAGKEMRDKTIAWMKRHPRSPFSIDGSRDEYLFTGTEEEREAGEPIWAIFGVDDSYQTYSFPRRQMLANPIYKRIILPPDPFKDNIS